MKGVKPSTFLSTHDEWHVFVIGFCEVLCPWPPRYKSMHRKFQKQMASEYHYYQFGRAIGVISWFTIAKLVHITFW